MKILIAGAGRAGLTIASHLCAMGHAVTVLERDPSVVHRAFEQHGLVALTGDATDAELLREAGVENADVAAALLHRDADNLAVALFAKSAGTKRVMVRMRDANYRQVYMAAGVDCILSETEILMWALATAIEFETIQHSMVLGNGESIAFEMRVPPGAALIGKSVEEIDADPNFPSSCVFAGMFEEQGALTVPRGSSVVQEGMTILLVARREELKSVVEFLNQECVREGVLG
jgi:trk system potassium uptake protein TrkA